MFAIPEKLLFCKLKCSTAMMHRACKYTYILFFALMVLLIQLTYIQDPNFSGDVCSILAFQDEQLTDGKK